MEQEATEVPEKAKIKVKEKVKEKEKEKGRREIRQVHPAWGLEPERRKGQVRQVLPR